MLEEINRRNFITLCALGALPGLLGACQAGSSNAASVVPTTTTQPSPASTDWSQLGSSLQGTLVLPDSPQYTVAHRLFDPRFDAIRPAAVAYCVSPADVQACLAFVRRFNVPFATRAGGHSYAGYSTTTGLMLDVTRMNGISVNVESGIASIGAGARLIDVYAALARNDLVLPAGSCPTVGIAGLTLGGGVGVLGRKYGLTCDSLLGADVILADGRKLTCDATHDADLFWALRGGGGGNFGVVTSFTFQTHRVSTLSLFTLDWPWSSAAAVLDAWQTWAPQAPDEVWSNCLLLATDNKRANPLVRVNGVYVGEIAPLNALLQVLTDKIHVAPSSRYVWNAGLLDAMLYEAGCKSVADCQLPGQGQVQREIAGARSDYFNRPIPRQGLDILVNAISQRQSSSVLGSGGIGIDAYGGAINRVAADATAFVHRDALFCAQYSGSWNVGDSDSIVAANRSWLADLWQRMRPYANGAAYQNYIDPDLSNWQQAYYGANLSRLQRIKASYDPHNLFRFAQSIPLP